MDKESFRQDYLILETNAEKLESAQEFANKSMIFDQFRIFGYDFLKLHVKRTIAD